MFKGNRSSAVRFCERATELPYSSLWGNHAFELAIAQVRQFWRTNDESKPTATAIGVVHDIYGFGHPMLPVEVEFYLSGRHPGFSGGGEVSLMGWSENRFYQARIWINDPKAVIYSAFKGAFEHTVLSGNKFAHLTLRRDGRLNRNDVADDQHQKRDRTAHLSNLMRQVDAEKASLPSIEFDGVSFDDILRAKSPAWADLWSDTLRFGNRLPGSLMDADTAKWRTAQKRQHRTK